MKGKGGLEKETHVSVITGIDVRNVSLEIDQYVINEYLCWCLFRFQLRPQSTHIAVMLIGSKLFNTLISPDFSAL